MSSNRKLQYSLAINEALHQSMDKDPSVLLIGQGITSPWYVGSTCNDLVKKFSKLRVIDTSISENLENGIGTGAALAGMRPVIVHPRMDFMLYGLDPIINQAANWRYMTGGKTNVPVVFWAIINRRGEQAAHHSQALQTMFAHIPGLKVVAPSNAYDAKGLLISAIKDDNPVIFIDNRWFYGIEDEVSEEMYEVPIGKGEKKREGNDITIVSYSYMLKESLEAVEELGIDAEVIDLKSLKPLDRELILESVKKTGKLLVVDDTWKSYGISAEILATVAESGINCIVKRITLPDIPAPASSNLEDAYYIDKEKIIEEINSLKKEPHLGL